MGKRIVVLALVALAVGLGWAHAANAATYTVCGYSYTAGGSAPDSCMSLATAVSDAVASQGSDTIDMLPGDYCPIDVEQNANSPITFEGVGLQAYSPDTVGALVGPEAALTTIKYDADNCGDSAPSSVVKLNTFVSSGVITFENLQIDATGVQYGLFVINSANVKVRDSIVTGASIAGVDYTTGPGIEDYGIDVDHSLIEANVNGVIVNGFGSVYASTVTQNTNTGIASSGEMSLGSDTITANLIGVSLSGNSQAVGSIVAANTEDCTGNAWESMFSEYNLAGSTCQDYDANDTLYDPEQGAIGSLAANGGPTPSILPPTQALTEPGNLCGLDGSDQREARNTGTCEIGAVNTHSVAAPSPATSDVDFGTLGTGQSQSTAVSAINDGGDLIGVTGIDISGAGWSIAFENCTYPLLGISGSNCSANIQFVSSTLGENPGTLTFHTTAGDVVSSLTATVVAAPAVQLSADELDFPDTNAGTTSVAQTVTLTNTGQAAMSIDDISLTGSAAGDYSVTTTCTTTLATTKNCTFSVKFSPKQAGNREASLEIDTDAPTSPDDVSLSGHGTGTTAQTSPSSLTFADTLVGKTTAGKSITLKNTGTVPLVVSGLAFVGEGGGCGGECARTNAAPVVSPGGDWSATNGCAAKVAVNHTCTITVKFQPTETGDDSNTLEVTANLDGGPLDVSVDGTGIQGDLTLTSTSLDFDDALVKQKEGPEPITLGNDGTAPIALSSIKITGTGAAQFKLKNACHSSLAVGISCDINVTFEPTKVGSFTAAVTIKDNATGNPHSISLSGTALAIPTATATPSTLTFSAPHGTSSDTKIVTLTNTSTTTSLNVSNVKLVDSGATQFAIVDDGCTGEEIAPADTCTVTVKFSPTKKETTSAHIQFTDDAATVQKVKLTGTAS